MITLFGAALLVGCAAERAYEGAVRSGNEIVTIRGMNPSDPLIPSGWVSLIKKVDGRALSSSGASVELLPGKHILEVYCGRPGAKPVTQTISMEAEGGAEYGIGVIRATNDCNVYQRTRGKLEWKYPESVSLPVDQRDRWQWGTNRTDFDEAITESVPKGQSLNNWREIITFQYYSSQRRRFTRFGDMNTISARLKEKEWVLNSACPNSSFEILNAGSEDTVYSWRTSGCNGHEAQFEFARFVRTSNGIHRIAYAKKGAGYTDEEKRRWLKIINAATIAQK